MTCQIHRTFLPPTFPLYGICTYTVYQTNCIWPTFTGQDHNITSSTISVHFPANATNAAFSISLIDDHIHKNNENFTLKIIPSSASKLPSNITIGVNHTATVIIKDVDGKHLAKIYIL